MKFTFTMEIDTDRFDSFREMRVHVIEEFKTQIVPVALSLNENNITRTAAYLSMTRTCFQRNLRNLGLYPDVSYRKLMALKNDNWRKQSELLNANRKRLFIWCWIYFSKLPTS